MSTQRGDALIGEDTVIQGEIRNCRQIEIYGYLEGTIDAERVVIHETGRCFGTVVADAADVSGTLQGEIKVRNLIEIRSSGSVSGNVQYGSMAMDSGGILTAEVRNVPPEIAGDLRLTVRRGRPVTIKVGDLTAIDPDDAAADLTYTVSNARNGSVVSADAPERRLETFTQAELENGKVNFLHDGSSSSTAAFEVVVRDDEGASSGRPQRVEVAVNP